MPLVTPRSLGVVGSTSNLSAFPLTTTANINAGDFVLVAVAVFAGTVGIIGVTSITDGTNDASYARIGSAVQTSPRNLELWGAPLCKAVASGATLTVNLAQATGASSALCLFHAFALGSGMDTTDQVNTGNSGAGTSGGLSTATGTLSNPNEYVIGVGYSSQNIVPTGSSGFSNNQQNNGTSPSPGSLTTDYQIVISTGAITYAPTWSPTTSRLLQIIQSFYMTPFDMGGRSAMALP